MACGREKRKREDGVRKDFFFFLFSFPVLFFSFFSSFFVLVRTYFDVAFFLSSLPLHDLAAEDERTKRQ